LWLTAVTGDGRILGYPDDKYGWVSMLQEMHGIWCDKMEYAAGFF